VAIPAQQKPGSKPDDPSTDNHNPGHSDPAPLKATREAYARPRSPARPGAAETAGHERWPSQGTRPPPPGQASGNGIKGEWHAPAPPILPPQDGFLFLDRDKFAASFAADVPEKLAAFMADSQVGFGVDALNAAVSEPAWRTKPSWYLVTTDDQMIPPPAQRAMSERAKAAVTDAPASHAVYVSQPAVVAQLIKQAANAAS
jgi:hypothetical protein